MLINHFIDTPLIYPLWILLVVIALELIFWVFVGMGHDAQHLQMYGQGHTHVWHWVLINVGNTFRGTIFFFLTGDLLIYVTSRITTGYRQPS